VQQLQLDLWQLLDRARAAPASADVAELCDRLEGLDLVAGGDAIVEIAEIHRSRAQIAIEELTTKYLPPSEPVVPDELWAHLWRKTFVLNDDHLYLELQSNYPAERVAVMGYARAKEKSSGSVDFEDLAHEEEISRWVELIRSHLAPGRISLGDLQRASGLSAIQVWLALLLSGCELRPDPDGDFYAIDSLWISRIDTDTPIEPIWDL
jgi:hypothetical protein